ncbi:MAG: type II secretion system protein GspD [Phycisphaerae bacterium]
MNSKVVVLSAVILMASFSFAITDSEGEKQAVISQLKQLFEVSPEVIVEEDYEEPYIKIIPGTEERSTLVYRCRYSDCKQIADGLEAIISRNGLVEDSDEKNLVVVNDASAKMEEIKQTILAMDHPVPQILVEAKIVEVSATEEYIQDLTFNYNTDGSARMSADGSSVIRPDMFSFTPYTVDTGAEGVMNNIEYFLEWLKGTNEAQILSSPNVVVSLGSQGSIVTGEDLPIYSTSITNNTVNTDVKYKRTGISLDVTPQRINNKTVKLKVNPEVSTVTRYEKYQDINTPVVSIRNIETELTVSDGQIIMLGGLYSTEELAGKVKVPVLGYLPWVGELFTSRDNSSQVKQLIFFMKVRIVKSASGTIVDVEKQASELRKVGDIINNSKILFPGSEGEEE